MLIADHEHVFGAFAEGGDARIMHAQPLVAQHDARIATFGERAEDMFVISDEHDHPLTESARQQLHDAMLACLDPDRNAGDPH